MVSKQEIRYGKIIILVNKPGCSKILMDLIFGVIRYFNSFCSSRRHFEYRIVMATLNLKSIVILTQ